jgi:hypothetical protein
VRGKALVHLHCHIGLDTLSRAARGARASGPDFPAPAVAAVRGLARCRDSRRAVRHKLAMWMRSGG